MAASLVFSVILVSSLAVFIASQGREEMYSAADAGDYFGDEFRTIEAAQGYAVLLDVQAVLGTNVTGCAVAVPALDRALSSYSDAQGAGNLTVSVTAAPIQGTASQDNLSALRPFNGSVPGEVDVALRFDGSGGQGGSVAFSREVTHFAHLGARLQAEVSDCEDAVGAVEGALSRSVVANCTEPGVAPLVQSAARGPSARAAEDGFTLGVAYAVTAEGSCSVAFRVSIDQAGIPGPGGTFSVRLEEGGTASVVTSSSARA